MIVDLTSVSKRYQRQAALRSVDFTGNAGEVVALVGANGAGKTTLLKIIATLIRPTRGEYMAFGVPAWERRTSVRARLGYVGHRPFVYPELSCTENLRFFGRLFDIADIDSIVRQRLDVVGLSERAGQPASALSRGLLQRLDLARATLHSPDLLVLDEPDTGLDTRGREFLHELLRDNASRGAFVIFTSHALPFAEQASDRLVTLNNGEIAAIRSRGPATVGRSAP